MLAFMFWIGCALPSMFWIRRGWLSSSWSKGLCVQKVLHQLQLLLRPLAEVLVPTSKARSMLGVVEQELVPTSQCCAACSIGRPMRRRIPRRRHRGGGDGDEPARLEVLLQPAAPDRAAGSSPRGFPAAARSSRASRTWPVWPAPGRLPRSAERRRVAVRAAGDAVLVAAGEDGGQGLSLVRQPRARVGRGFAG